MTDESITYKSALELAIQTLTEAAAQIDKIAWRWPRHLNQHQRDELQRAAQLKAAAACLQAHKQKPR